MYFCFTLQHASTGLCYFRPAYFCRAAWIPKRKHGKRTVAFRAPSPPEGMNAYCITLPHAIAEYVIQLGQSEAASDEAAAISNGICKLATWYRELGSPHLRDL